MFFATDTYLYDLLGYLYNQYKEHNMHNVHYITCDATKVHFIIILIITQVPSMKLIKLVFSRRLMRDDGKCILCFVLHGY